MCIAWHLFAASSITCLLSNCSHESPEIHTRLETCVALLSKCHGIVSEVENDSVFLVLYLETALCTLFCFSGGWFLVSDNDITHRYLLLPLPMQDERDLIPTRRLSVNHFQKFLDAGFSDSYSKLATRLIVRSYGGARSASEVYLLTFIRIKLVDRVCVTHCAVHTISKEQSCS